LRDLHGFDSKEPTWEWPRWGGGYRLDQLIASSEVAVSECAYRRGWRRDDRLSDHSALVAELRIEDPSHARVSARSRLWRNW
jgi:endonuclease/exonuclease/phosphatase family metal-dependent hydrolase